MDVRALSADGCAELRVRLLFRGQRSPSGNQVQLGLERSKHKPGKRPKPSSLLLLCFCSHEKQWQSLRAVGNPGLPSGLPLARVGCSEALAARHVTKSAVGHREESLPSKARGEAVELFRKLVSCSQAGRGITCSII